jgi:hypothetical protein
MVNDWPLGLVADPRQKNKRSKRMKSKLFVPLFVVGLLALVAGAVSFAKEELGPYQLLTTISIPGNLSGAFDISWVDSASERYYLSE